MTTAETHPRLLAGCVVLVVAQLAHLLDALRTSPENTFPEVLVDPVALVGMGTVAGAAVALAVGHRWGPSLAFAAAAGVVAGFLLVHAVPAELGGLNNPYWTADEGSRADAIQWVTVIVVLALGVAVAVEAWRAARPSIDRPQPA